MKQNILFLLIFTLYISNTACMFFSDEEQKVRMNQVILNAMTKSLKKPIVLRPTNKDVKDANVLVNSLCIDRDLASSVFHLTNSIKSKEDDFIKLNTINSIMTFLLFEANYNGDDEPATATISDTYIKIFPDLFAEIFKTAPKDLVLKSAWQIISTMPTLYHTICRAGLISSWKFGREEFDELSKFKNLYTLVEYLRLMARTALSDFPQKEILLTRLVQKLGENVQFLDYVAQQIKNISVFKDKFDAIEKKYEGYKPVEDMTTAERLTLIQSGSIDEYLTKVIEKKSEIKNVQDQIYLILKEIDDFKAEVNKKNIEEVHHKLESIAIES